MRLQAALHHAFQAHAEEKDKQGFLYIIHPISVSFALQEIGENAQVAGLLHDVLEDCPRYGKMQDLLDKLSIRQMETIELLTRADQETYHDYVCELLYDEDACWVKLADLGHNTCNKRVVPSSDMLLPEGINPVEVQEGNERRNDQRYFPHASLVVSALLEYHKQPLDKIERVLYAYDHD
jgi:hypothetical protein